MVGGKGQKKKPTNKLIGGKEPEPRSRVGEGNSPGGTPCDGVYREAPYERSIFLEALLALHRDIFKYKQVLRSCNVYNEYFREHGNCQVHISLPDKYSNIKRE